MTDTNKPDISREAVGNLSDAVKTEARDALRRDDTTAYLMLLTASETFLALRDELDKRDKTIDALLSALGPFCDMIDDIEADVKNGKKVYVGPYMPSWDERDVAKKAFAAARLKQGE